MQSRGPGNMPISAVLQFRIHVAGDNPCVSTKPSSQCRISPSSLRMPVVYAEQPPFFSVLAANICLRGRIDLLDPLLVDRSARLAASYAAFSSSRLASPSAYRSATSTACKLRSSSRNSVACLQHPHANSRSSLLISPCLPRSSKSRNMKRGTWHDTHPPS